MSAGDLLELVRSMPSRVKAIAFLDLDGPIIDVSLRYFTIYSEGVVRLGGSPISRARFWSAKRHKIPDREILALSGLADAGEAYKAIKLSLIESPSYLVHDCLQAGVTNHNNRTFIPPSPSLERTR